MDADIERLAARMRRLGVSTLRLHRNGAVAELVLGLEPIAESEPVHRPVVAAADARATEAARVRRLALHGLGGRV